MIEKVQMFGVAAYLAFRQENGGSPRLSSELLHEFAAPAEMQVFHRPLAGRAGNDRHPETGGCPPFKRHLNVYAPTA